MLKPSRSKSLSLGRRPEAGQALILGLLAMTVVFIIGVIIVDFGLWLTERRGAQKDADASTMAGAFELLGQDFVNVGNNDPAAVRGAAEGAAYDWAGLNGLPDADVKNLNVDDTDCLGPSSVIDTVELAAEHHGGSLFTSIFGILVPQIGAPAKACLGSQNTAEGLLPLGVQITGPKTDCWRDVDGDGEEDPLYGQECIITFGAGGATSGEAGHLRLYDDGSNACSAPNTGGNAQWRDEVSNGGANTLCHVYKYFPDLSLCDQDPGGCVYSQTGIGGTATLDAFNALLVKEGTAGYDCDARFGDGDGTDQLLETVQVINGASWPSPQAVFAKRDCTSPRVVSLIIVAEFTSAGNPPLPIEAFAGFFLEGCQIDNNKGLQFSSRCDKNDFQGQIGQVQMKGFFLNILGREGGVGQITKWSPKRIVLVD